MNHLGIHVINEAYSKLQGWAGASMKTLFTARDFVCSPLGISHFYFFSLVFYRGSLATC